MTTPFKFWTFDHWLNFGIFILGAVTAVGITASTRWYDVPNLFTPATVIGFLISVMGFLRASQTNAARDPEFGTRKSDPNPTVQVEQVGPNTVVAVPPVTAGFTSTLRRSNHETTRRPRPDSLLRGLPGASGLHRSLCDREHASHHQSVSHWAGRLQQDPLDGEKVGAFAHNDTVNIVTWHKSTVQVIAASGAYWKAAAQTALDELVTHLSAAAKAKVAPYVPLATAILQEV